MPGPVIHIGVALVALLVYFDDRHRKYVLLLLPFAVLPDLDHFAPLYAGRDILHNVFLLVPPLAVALYGLKTKNSVLYSVALMAGFLLFSHLVLDFFNGGEALFYPLRTTWYGFTNTWGVAHSAVALIPEPLRGVSRVLFGNFATPDAAYPAVALLPKPLRGVPSEVFGVTLTFVALAAILFVERQLQFNIDVRGVQNGPESAFSARLAVVAGVDLMPFSEHKQRQEVTRTRETLLAPAWPRLRAMT